MALLNKEVKKMIKGLGRLSQLLSKMIAELRISLKALTMGALWALLHKYTDMLEEKETLQIEAAEANLRKVGGIKDQKIKTTRLTLLIWIRYG